MTQVDTARDALIVPLRPTSRRIPQTRTDAALPMGQVLLFTGVRYERPSAPAAIAAATDPSPAPHDLPAKPLLDS